MNCDFFKIVNHWAPPISVVNVPTIAKRIDCTKGACHTTGSGLNVAPSVVSVLYDGCTNTVKNADDIALDIGDVVVGSAVVGHRHGGARSIVSEVQRIVTYGHLAQLVTVVDVAVGGAAIGSLGS